MVVDGEHCVGGYSVGRMWDQVKGFRLGEGDRYADSERFSRLISS
jgi:hypothetical protein